MLEIFEISNKFDKMNFLEELIAEWYEYQGYFIRRNIKVQPRDRGGYEGELDVIAFHPESKHLIHIEASTDTDSWNTRERRFNKKFELGRTHIPQIFSGLDLPTEIEQIAVFYLGSKTRETIGGGKLMMVSELLKIIYDDLKSKSIWNKVVPESFPLIRMLQVFIFYKDSIIEK